MENLLSVANENRPMKGDDYNYGEHQDTGEHPKHKLSKGDNIYNI